MRYVTEDQPRDGAEIVVFVYLGVVFQMIWLYRNFAEIQSL